MWYTNSYQRVCVRVCVYMCMDVSIHVRKYLCKYVYMHNGMFCFVFVAYIRTTRLVLSATLSIYGRRKPATPVALSVAVNLRAPAGTDNQGCVSHLRMSADSASHYHRLGNVTLADISAGPPGQPDSNSGPSPHQFGVLETALLLPPYNGM